MGRKGQNFSVVRQNGRQDLEWKSYPENPVEDRLKLARQSRAVDSALQSLSSGLLLSIKRPLPFPRFHIG